MTVQGDIVKHVTVNRSVATSSSDRPGVSYAASHAAGVFGRAIPGEGANEKTESLGTRVIEGVRADGTRTVVTIPAGAIGNDLPIEIVSERWYSPELQMVVMTKRNDPRMGETVYRLSNVNRSEPSRSLFEAPADYTVTDAMVPLEVKIKEEKVKD